MLTVPLVAVLALALFTGASFGFALAETALFSLGQWRVRQLAERMPAVGGLVSRLLAVPHDLLATIVLGNTFANAGLVALGLWVADHEGWPVWAVGGGVLVLILVGGEAIPKALAVRAPEFWALRVARPMVWMQAATRPLRKLAQGMNAMVLRWIRPPAQAALTAEEEYRELLELGFQEGALRLSEKEIILQIISLDRRMARDVMKPRAQMVALPDDLPVEQMMAMARQIRHRRIPLYDDTPETIVGVLNTRQLLLNPEADLSEAIEFPSFVSETINLLELLRRLQRQRRGLAIVLDEYGSTAGLVTTEDILGAVVGRIRGEGEGAGFVMEKLAPGRWRVNGTMRIEDFRREYPNLGVRAGVDTMGGLLTALAEVVPPPGFAVKFGRLRLTATVADERRVREVLVEDLVQTGGGGMIAGVWTFVVLGVALALAFLFAGMEAGVFALSRVRLRQRARAGQPSARLLYGFLQHPEDFLWTILVGNTVADVAAVGLAFSVLRSGLAGQPGWLAACGAVAVFLIYALADLLPKMLFRQYPNRLCLALARPFGLIHLLLSPAVAVVARLTDLLLRFTGGRRFEGRLFGNRDELRWLMQESAGGLTTEERTMVNRALDLQNLTVTAIGLPLDRVVMTTTQTPLAEVLRVCRETGLNRLPVREPHSGRIVGILTLRNVLCRADEDPRQVAGALLQPATFVDDTTRLEEALRRLRETGQRLAIVLDRNRQEVGIITLYDILRFLFGEVNL